MPITVKSLASAGRPTVGTPRNARTFAVDAQARRLLRALAMPALVALIWIAGFGPTTMTATAQPVVLEQAASPGLSLALAPDRARLSASSTGDGAILIVDITPAPPSLEAALLAAPTPADLALRVERFSSDKVRLRIAARDGRCIPRLRGRIVKCHRLTEVEASARVTAMIREPLAGLEGDAAIAAQAADQLAKAGDFEAAAQRYALLRRGYTTRGAAELRLGDLLWLAGQPRDAVAEWSQLALRFHRRAEGRIAAMRAAAAFWNLEGVLPAVVPEAGPAEEPFGADAALARAHLLCDLGRYEAAIEQLRVAPPASLRPSFDSLRNRSIGAGIRLTAIRGEPMRTTILFRRHFALVRALPERVDLELATADALLDLDLVQEAVEVVDDALGAARPGDEQERVGTWIARVRSSIEAPARPAPPPGTHQPHPLFARITALAAEVDAMARRSEVRP